MSPRRANARSRVVRVAFAALLAAIALATWWLVATHNLGLLARLGFPTMDPPFGDLRTITGASVSLADGLDPLAANPGDPWGRPMNYPRVWLALAHLGLAPEHTAWLALFVFVAFAAGLVVLLPLVTDGFVLLALAAAVLAPPTWFAIERANIDLLMFGMVSVAAWLASRHRRVANVLVAAAAALKLYPAFALANLLGASRQRAMAIAAGVMLPLAAYGVWTRRDLILIATHTEHWTKIEYGIAKVPMALAARTDIAASVWLAVAAGVLAAAAGLALRLRRRVCLGTSPSQHAHAAFLSGAGIYLGTFCLGRNFDYRLVFLALTVPQLVHWLRTTTGASRRLLGALLGVQQLVLWSLTWRQIGPAALVGGEHGLLLDEGLTWLCCLGLGTTFVLAMPDWALPRRFRDRPLLDARALGPIACWQDAAAASLSGAPFPQPTRSRENRSAVD